MLSPKLNEVHLDTNSTMNFVYWFQSGFLRLNEGECTLFLCLLFLEVGWRVCRLVCNATIYARQDDLPLQDCNDKIKRHD